MNNERGVILVSFVLMMAILLVGLGALYAFSFADWNASLRNEAMTQAIYIAEAGIDRKLTELSQKNTANLSGSLSFDSTEIRQGTYEVFYGVVADAGNGNKVLVNPDTQATMPVSQYTAGDEVIVSTGTVTLNGVEQARRTLRVTVQPSPLVQPRAAVTISGVASTNGAVIVDGREHDISGNLTGGPGTYGVSTASSTFNQGGNSQIGGNGIAPANPANPITYEVNGPPVPDSPEKVLGLDEGALDSFKTPLPPSTPFNGVVYLTASWEGVNLEGSSGILICHNAAGDAFLKNIHGTFRGLIITDDIIHINGDAKIIGAIFGMKSGGVTLGNGSGEVKFSEAVLSSLPLTGYTVSSWEDSRND